ncbi:MAG: hypothetical protein U0525_05215 [Patescibacteria group bacterium]
MRFMIAITPKDKFIEHEVKVLDIDVQSVCVALEKMGAMKVFDSDRIFTYFDFHDGRLLNSDQEIRLTEEGEKLKLSFAEKVDQKQRTIKVFTSAKHETVSFLEKVGLKIKFTIKSHRVSYELNGVEFDIDSFPGIPSFLEIDTEFLKYPLTQLLSELKLENHEMVTMSTLEIYKKYGVMIQEQQIRS